MKIGVCRGYNDFDAMRVAAEIGIDYWECAFDSIAKCSDEDFKKSKAMLAKYNLQCLTANHFVPSDIKVVGDKVDYSFLSSYLEKGFERAAELGIKKVVFGSGKSRSWDEGFSPEKAKEQMAYFLREYASEPAKKAECIIVLEPLSFCESAMIHTVSDGAEIARLAGVDNVFCLADLYHVFSNKESFESIANFKGFVKHSHIAEPFSRCYPSFDAEGESVEICKEFLKLMNSVGCDTVSIEARTDNFGADLEKAVEFLESTFKEYNI